MHIELLENDLQFNKNLYFLYISISINFKDLKEYQRFSNIHITTSSI